MTILLGGALAASAQPPAAAAMPAPAPAPAQPAAAPAQPPAAPAAMSPAPAAMSAEPEKKVATVAKPHLSACARAIHATERKLDRSTASSSTIAAAWQHIEEAKKTKGAQCEEHAKQASEML
jgi:hypothetical protein